MIINRKILDSINTVLHSVQLNPDVSNILLNPLANDITNHASQSQINADVERISKNLGGLLKLQYTNDISLLTPYCMNVLYRANTMDNRCLMNLTARKNQAVNGLTFFDFIHDLNFNAKYTINNAKMDMAKKHDTASAKRAIPQIYQHNQIIQNLYWIKIKAEHASHPKFRYLLKHTNRIFNQYLVDSGLIKISKHQAKLTQLGKRFADLTDDQINDYISMHHFNCETKLGWNQMLIRIRDVFRNVIKTYPISNNLGIALALTLCDCNAYSECISFKFQNNLVIALDPFVFLSCFLTIFNNMLHHQHSIKPNRNLINMIARLRALSITVRDFEHQLEA